MSLWGATTTDESKPKHLSDVEKRDVYATKEGWVKRTTGTGGRAGRVHEEILVAIGELSGGAAGTKKLAAGTISSTRFKTLTVAAGTSLFEAEVVFNEAVDVTGVPTLELTVGSGTASLLYVAGKSTVNRLHFEADITAAENDLISLGANKLAGTVTDKDAGTNSVLDHSAQAATTNITVAA